MEKSAENIQLYSKWGFLIYCDGYTAKITSVKPAKDQEGNDVWEFVLNPSDELIKRYNLKPNNKGNMLYTTQLPYEMVIQLNPDPAWNRWLCLLNYKGETNPATEILRGTSQQKIIMEQKKEIREEKSKREVAHEQLSLMQKNLPRYMKENVSPFLEQLAPLIPKLMEKKNE